MSRAVKNIKKAITELDAQRKKLVSQLGTAYGNKTFPCVFCNKRHKFKDCDAIQTHWYEEPYSCSGGDNWYENELWILCPTTQHYNRMLFLSDCCVKQDGTRTNHNRAFNMRYKKTFKSITDTYRDEPTNWCNNDHIDKNPNEYGLLDSMY